MHQAPRFSPRLPALTLTLPPPSPPSLLPQGVASGFIGAGGNAGSAITQAAFFTGVNMTTAEGFRWMGVMIIACTATLVVIHFPMWGGMFTRPSGKVRAGVGGVGVGVCGGP